MGKQLPGGFGGGGGGFGSQQPTQMGAQQALGQMGGGGGMNLSAFNPQQSMSYVQPFMQQMGGFGGQPTQRSFDSTPIGNASMDQVRQMDQAQLAARQQPQRTDMQQLFGQQLPSQTGQQVPQMGAAQPYMQSLGGFGGQQMSAAQPYMQSLGGFGGQQLGAQESMNRAYQDFLGQQNFGGQQMGNLQRVLGGQSLSPVQSQQAAQFSSVPGAMQGQQNPTFAPMDRGRLPPGVPGFAEQYAGSGIQPTQRSFDSTPGWYDSLAQERGQAQQMGGQQPAIRDTRYDPVRDAPRPGGMFGGEIKQSLQDLSARLRGGAPQQPTQTGALQAALNSAPQQPMISGGPVPNRPNTQQVRPEDARVQAMRRIQQMANRMRNPLYVPY